MATATTTAKLIRDNQRDIVEALNPTQLGECKFKQYNRHDFLDWSAENVESSFRRFYIEDLRTYSIPLGSDMTTESVETTFRVTVAYPRDYRYGRDREDGLADAIESDRNLIDTAIGIFGQGDYVAGQDAAILEEQDLDRDGDVWFMALDYSVHFKREIELNVVITVPVVRTTEDGFIRWTEISETRITE